jgi:molybdopterin-binding protein
MVPNAAAPTVVFGAAKGGVLEALKITADAVRALKLRRGDEALAILKSTEVMIARRAVR